MRALKVLCSSESQNNNSNLNEWNFAGPVGKKPLIKTTSDAPCWNTVKKINKEIKARSVLGRQLCCDEFSIPNDVNIDTDFY